MVAFWVRLEKPKPRSPFISIQFGFGPFVFGISSQLSPVSHQLAALRSPSLRPFSEDWFRPFCLTPVIFNEMVALRDLSLLFSTAWWLFGFVSKNLSQDLH